MICAVVDGRGPHRGAPYDRAGNDPRVINEHVMVGSETRVKYDIEQTRVVPTLALVANVQHERFRARAGSVGKGIDSPFALPDDQAVGPRHRRQAQRVGEHQISKRNHGRPVPGDDRRCLGHLVVKKWSNSPARLQAVSLGREGDLGIGGDRIGSAGRVADVIHSDRVIAVQREERNRKRSGLRITEGGGIDGDTRNDRVIGWVGC